MTAAVAGLALNAGCGSTGSTTTSAAKTTPASVKSGAATGRQITKLSNWSVPAGAVKPAPGALGHLAKVAKGSGPIAHISGISTLPLPQQLTTLDGDLNNFWGQEFAASKVQWPAAYENLVASKPVQTGCSSRPTIAPTDPWLLCEPTFYWTIPWIEQNIANKGDVNLAFNVAEMWSFHVQNLLGYTQALTQGSITKGQWAQQTMCLTGLWVRSLSQRNLFEQGDSQAAASFLSALDNVNGITAPDVSPAQLQQAFLASYQSGDPSTCSIGGSSTSGSSSQTTTGATSTTTT